MSLPSSSSNSSSPSFSIRAHSSEDVAAACFNPLFISTSSAPHNNHHLNHSQNSTIANQIHHNHNHFYNSIKNYHSINHSKNHIHSSITGNSMAGNSSPNFAQLTEASPSRKVHVVYYLSRSGQLEHPHLLEVSIPPNQGLYLRDVKKRLAAIRGKRLPLAFAWSYKRSYKNGYVWQDLCDDDLIFPAHGCEYVLKGSEILSDQSNNEDCTHTSPHTPAAGLSTQNGSKEDQGIPSIIPKGVYQNHEDNGGAASLCVSMVESGTDAATQTEEELRRSDVEYTHEHEENSSSLYVTHYKLNAKQLLTSSPQKASCTTTGPQHATELNRADMASPPSSSSATNSPSPYKELASTSSSSASGFKMPADHNAASNEHVKASEHNLGSKTPGRSWMKCAIHKLEEQEEMINSQAAGVEGGMSEDGSLANPAHESASSKNKYRTMASNSVGAVIMEEGEYSPTAPVKPSRSKHSGALSLLQFMSCGGLDIKEQILPMSLYRLRSKGAPVAANQLHMSNYILSPEQSGDEALGYGGLETGKLWTKIGKPKSLYGLSSKLLYKASDEENGVSDVNNQWMHHQHYYPHHEGALAVQAASPPQKANGSSSKTLGGSVPDVISIGRSSISDRSTNVSHELEYRIADAHAKLRKSGEVISTHNNGIKAVPRFNVRPEVSLDVQSNEGMRVATRAVSGEILMSKGSPLFVPSKRHLSYSGTPINYASNMSKSPLAQLSTSVIHLHEAGNNQTSMKLDGQNKACSSSCNPSRAFSEGEVLASRIVASNQKSMTINSYDQSMAQLWEELLAAPSATKSEEHQHKDADYQRVRQVVMGGSNSSREVERTLQNAVELSLQPPLEHLPLLLDCPQCGRKMKAELLKAHVKSCNSPKPNNTRYTLTTNTTTNNTNINTTITTTTTTNNNLGKSPKSDSNLCQRFLRASPPPPLPN